MENQINQAKVPYLSASKMEKLMELVSERSLTSISTEYFKNYGFGQADAYLAINTLKFLNVIDEKGKSTDVLRKFQLRGDARDEEVQQIIKVAYKKLFDAVTNPHELSKDDLTNEFMHHYSLSRRIAISAVPAFLKLCEFAGLVEQGSVLTRTRVVGRSDKKQLEPRGKSGMGSRSSKGTSDNHAVIPIADGKMEWRLPSEILTKMAFGGEVAEDIKSLTKQLSEFAKKYCEDNTK